MKRLTVGSTGAGGACRVKLRWAVKWHGRYHYDGEFLGPYGSRPLLFPTKAKAKAYINDKWGYIRDSLDLRRPPHNWRMPKAVRVEVILREFVA